MEDVEKEKRVAILAACLAVATAKKRSASALRPSSGTRTPLWSMFARLELSEQVHQAPIKSRKWCARHGEEV